MGEEGLQSTANEMIHIGQPILLDETIFWETLEQLREAARRDENDIRPIIKALVPTYQTPTDFVGLTEQVAKTI